MDHLDGVHQPECRTIEDVRQVLDLAEAARVYARMSGLGLEAQNHATEIKLRAKRRCSTAATGGRTKVEMRRP
jgi:hypothetical protein